ncbi:MAG TPA: protein kinase, partial [Gemmataceae bacterium]|nr:protein kinase [Gemmataceae bacterium]
KRQATDHRVDMFALGVTAYEVFTGDLPWERAQSLETVMSHLNSAGHDPRRLHPNIPDEVAKFLIKAVERDPAKRFQNPREFREALKDLEL